MNYDLRSLIISQIFLLHLYERKQKISIIYPIFFVVLFIDFVSSY
jgi:hypothetical protein